jgi:hypothetical protein
MNKKSYVFGIASILAIAAIGIASQDEIKLRRELKEGVADKYKLSIRSSQTMQLEGGMAGGMEMPMDFGFGAVMATKVGAKDEGGKADFELTFSEFEIDMGMMAGMMGDPAANMPKEQKVNAKLDELNRMSGFRIPSMGGPAGMLGGMMSSMGPLFVEFPEKAVTMGEKWTSTMPASPMTGNKEVKLESFIAGNNKVDDVECWIIVTKGKIPLAGNLSEMMRATGQGNQGGMAGMMPDNMTMKGSVDVNTETFVEKSTGRTLKVEGTMKTATTIEIPDQGMTVVTSGTSILKLVLVK